MNENSETIISIIIPTFNSADYIRKILDGILLQKMKLFEVLIIDNISTDDTLQIIKGYYSNKIKVFSSKDKGIYDAMNKGIGLSKGDWLYFMGADDAFSNSEVLTEIYKYFSDSVDLVYGDVTWMPENILEYGKWSYDIFINQNINHQRIFYRKTLFESYGKYQIKYKIAADYELNIRFFCNKSIKKKYVPLIISTYHSGGFSSGKIDLDFWNDWHEIVYNNFKNYLPKKAIYANMMVWCKYCISQQEYMKALKSILTVFIHTRSMGLLKLMGINLIKGLVKNAS